jgi:hypothetical protein
VLIVDVTSVGYPLMSYASHSEWVELFEPLSLFERKNLFWCIGPRVHTVTKIESVAAIFVKDSDAYFAVVPYNVLNSVDVVLFNAAVETERKFI